MDHWAWQAVEQCGKIVQEKLKNNELENAVQEQCQWMRSYIDELLQQQQVDMDRLLMTPAVRPSIINQKRTVVDSSSDFVSSKLEDSASKKVKLDFGFESSSEPPSSAMRDSAQHNEQAPEDDPDLMNTSLMFPQPLEAANRSRYDEAHPQSDILSFNNTASDEDLRGNLSHLLDSNILPDTLECESAFGDFKQLERELDEAEDVSPTVQSSQSSQITRSKAAQEPSQSTVGNIVKGTTSLLDKLVTHGNISSKDTAAFKRTIGNPVKSAAQKREEEEQSRQRQLKLREQEKLKRFEAAQEAKRREEEAARKRKEERQARILQNREALKAKNAAAGTLKGTVTTVTNTTTGQSTTLTAAIASKRKPMAHTPAKPVDEPPTKAADPSPALDPTQTIVDKVNGRNCSDDEDDSENTSGNTSSRKSATVPQWALTESIMPALRAQVGMNPDEIFGAIQPLHMEAIFQSSSSLKRTRVRTSSANWTHDKLTQQEVETYQLVMGFKKPI